MSYAVDSKGKLYRRKDRSSVLFKRLPNAQVDRAGQATPDKQDQKSSRLRSNDLLGGSTEKPDTTKQENQT